MAVKANGAKATMSSRPLWLPGSTAPAHLTGTLPGDYGFDPLGLGSDATLLSWFKEAELQHCRWAMAGAAGILGQEIFNPSVNFFEAGGKVDLPMSVPALLGIQFALMHYVEIRRWQDWRKPNSVNQDPIFSNNSLPDHEPGYPGGIFAPVIPGDLEVLKVKEIKNGRLAMVAVVGFFAQYHATGKGPLACLGAHLADPGNTTVLNSLSQ